MASHAPPAIPMPFLAKRLHSLMGIWLVLFLIEHLLVNSQAALLIGHDGSGFVRAVQSIRDLPYLPVIEVCLLAFPFLFHGILGISYALQSKINSWPTDGATPALPEYPKNRAYTWQRITSWILLFAVVAHVIHMRFIEYPLSVEKDTTELHLVRISQDIGLPVLAERLGVKLYNHELIQQQKELSTPILMTKDPSSFNEHSSSGLLKVQEVKQNQQWIEALEKYPLNDSQVIAATQNFGTAELLMVRDTFKSPFMMILYTLFVGVACFHAFNGLWTAFNRWGVTLSVHSQSLSRKFALFCMFFIGFLGLAAIWGTYWINLKQ